jgi:hypothetical protein
MDPSILSQRFHYISTFITYRMLKPIFVDCYELIAVVVVAIGNIVIVDLFLFNSHHKFSLENVITI